MYVTPFPGSALAPLPLLLPRPFIHRPPSKADAAIVSAADVVLKRRMTKTSMSRPELSLTKEAFKLLSNDMRLTQKNNTTAVGPTISLKFRSTVYQTAAMARFTTDRVIYELKSDGLRQALFNAVGQRFVNSDIRIAPSSESKTQFLVSIVD